MAGRILARGWGISNPAPLHEEEAWACPVTRGGSLGLALREALKTYKG